MLSHLGFPQWKRSTYVDMVKELKQKVMYILHLVSCMSEPLTHF